MAFDRKVPLSRVLAYCERTGISVIDEGGGDYVCTAPDGYAFTVGDIETRYRICDLSIMSDMDEVKLVLLLHRIGEEN